MSAFVRVDSGIRVSTSGVSSAARSLARAANRAGVTIIGVHPGRLGAARGPEESLLFLAGETGGDAIYNTNDVADRVQDSLVRRRGHYLIGFEPSSGKGASGPDRPIKVSLKTRRQGVSIRTRREVFEDSGLYAGAPVLGKLSDHLDHPLRGSLDVRLTPHVDWKDGGKSRILAQIAIARPDTPEATPGRIDIETELRALDRRGRILLNETRTVRLRPKTRWIEFAREFEVADPDLVEVAIAARIAGTALVGSAASLAELRRPKGLAFSTVAIRATPDGPPVMELENSGQVWMAVQVSGAARRNGRVDIELRTRLRRGQEIVLEDPPGGLSEALPEIFWVRATIETRSLGGGDYVCEVEALDRISNKRTTARREFRLLPPADVTRDR